MECASGVKYLMCDGTPWAMPVKCGRNQGPNCKRIEENLGRWQCTGNVGVGPLCGHLIWHKKSQHLQGGCWIMFGHKWQMEWQ